MDKNEGKEYKLIGLPVATKTVFGDSEPHEYLDTRVAVQSVIEGSPEAPID